MGAGGVTQEVQHEEKQRFETSTPALLGALRQVSATQPKAVRSNVHHYPVSLYANRRDSSNEAGPSTYARDRRITSWKMTEHLYFNTNNPFPTMARGLFTEAVEEGDPLPPGLEEEFQGSNVEERIVARGYDKFFSIDEVPWTEVNSHILGMAIVLTYSGKP